MRRLQKAALLAVICGTVAVASISLMKSIQQAQGSSASSTVLTDENGHEVMPPNPEAIHVRPERIINDTGLVPKEWGRGVGDVPKGEQLVEGTYAMWGISHFHPIDDHGKQRYMRTPDGDKLQQESHYRLVKLSSDDNPPGFEKWITTKTLLRNTTDLFEVLPLYRMYDVENPRNTVAMRITLIHVGADGATILMKTDR
jgi:hypothetical protein